MSRIGNGDGFAGDGDARALRLVAQADVALVGRREVRQKNIAPNHYRAGSHVADVQNGIGELLIENARLDFGGQLFGGQFVQDRQALADRERRQP